MTPSNSTGPKTRG